MLVNIEVGKLYSGEDLSSEILQAFGPNGLGALTISGVESFVQARRRLLTLTPALAALSDDVKALYEDPESSYNIGWSHGKEALSGGKKDTFKGSFYANPVLDEPCSDQALIRKYPAYFRPNLWPKEHLPELEPAFKELGQIIIEVGSLLLKRCDEYISSMNPACSSGQLAGVMGRSKNHKARLLHYFPALEDSDIPISSDQVAWCGWHTDHGSLTGLTSAMYIKDGREVGNPDLESGLYIEARDGSAVKAAIPADCIAYQVGEAMQIHSGGLLKATPHFVKTAMSHGSRGVSRSTFAVFMQPDVEEAMDIPPGSSVDDVSVGQWKPGQNFGQFTAETLKKYYGY